MELQEILTAIENVINPINNFLWTYVIILLLSLSGLWFTYKLRFGQLSKIGEMLRLLKEGVGANTKGSQVSSFQAFCISTASRVGVGNIAGIAIAIVLGGPGSIFWMWFIALLGSATGIVESTLAQIYKEPIKGGGFHGGPAYYIQKGLHSRTIAIWFAILISVTYGLIFNSVQSNTITASFQIWNLAPEYVGGAIAILSGIVIFGGATRIAKVTEFVVPIMAGLYILTAIFIVLTNITHLPAVLGNIFTSAFTFDAAGGGLLGAAVMNGFKRGLFSNEAGMGSVPNAAATAQCSHPAKQGLIQGFGVFVDTMFVCTSTAFIVLMTDDYTATSLTGIALVQHNLAIQLGSWAPTAMAFFIFTFAFSSIVGNYYYGEVNISHLSKNKIYLNLFRAAVVLMVFIGSIATLPFVWNMADFFMALMVLTNVVAIFLLGKQAFICFYDYFKQKAEGIEEPVFKGSTLGEKVEKQLDWWK